MIWIIQWAIGNYLLQSDKSIFKVLLITVTGHILSLFARLSGHMWTFAGAVMRTY